MKKLFILTFSLILTSLVSFALTPITGTTSACIGSSSLLHDTTAGGTWTSSNTGIATVGASTGLVTGMTAGTVTITYTLGTYVTTTFTVSGTVPAAITGTTTFCVGTTSTLSDATPGGTWSSSYTYVATVGSATGLVTGASGGSATIYYSIGGCSASALVTITPKPTVALTGASTVCAGSAITLSDSTGTGGGVWTSGNTAIATVSGGVVTGVSAGVVTISYAVTGTCGTTVATKSITVSSTTSPGTITGASSVYIGSSATLYDGVSGGTWSSSNPAIASISSTGVVTGVALGSVTITYSVTGCSGLAYTTAPMTVAAINGISGHVLFTGVPHSGSVRVWLITYNPTTLDLQAIDSVTVSSSGSSAYYQFVGAATDSFRMKATAFDTGVTGYIPTYRTSSFYWNYANVLYHTSGTSDYNQDITMNYGTTTSGPGFIGGNVTTGANKGTGSAPAIGLPVFILNSSGALIQQTKTDASGAYSFGNLPLGTYTIFPEALNYNTTAYTSITLTSGAPSMMVASFVQHTLSHSITPVTEGVNSQKSNVSSVFVFPNPSNGKLNIQWNTLATEKGNVTISDITGRQVFSTTLNVNEGTGVSQLDLSGLNNGIYMVNIKSASINYTNKIEIQK